MTEFRIYYESLEQGHDYISPIIREVLRDGIGVKLIKKANPQSCESMSGVMRGIHKLVAPDVLISAVADDTEVPLIIIEFTDSVKAEDHELQRSYGAVAAFIADIFYIKISGYKESMYKFGGADFDPYMTPKILSDLYGYEGFIFAEWEREEGNPLRLMHTPGLPGCPPKIPLVIDTIQKAVIAFSQKPQKWFATAVGALKDTESFKAFVGKRNAAHDLEHLVKTWQGRKKQRYFVDAEKAGAKLYRFKRAMDPDRGIITFISCVFSKSRKIYGKYSLTRSFKDFREAYDGLEGLRDRLEAVLDYDGMPGWFKQMLLSGAERLTEKKEAVSIQREWLANRHERWSRVIMTLAYFTDGIYLGEDGPLLTWDRNELLDGDVNKEFHDLIKRRMGFDQKSFITPVEKISGTIDEDEVTYALVHRILKKHGFQVVAVSYPGAQGGSPILPEKKKGRIQKRKYPDVIAVPPLELVSFDAILNESKGEFKQGAVKEDVEKLQRYKDSDDYKGALKTMLVKAKIIDADHHLREIVVGVSFGVSSKLETKWRVDLVDFIFRIVNREQWGFATFRQDLRDLISETEGATDFPACYRISQPSKTNKRRKPAKKAGAPTLFK